MEYLLNHFLGMDRFLPEIKNKKVRKLRERVLAELTSSGVDFAFTSFAEGEKEYTIDQDRAEQIIDDLPRGDFRLEPVFIKYEDDWVIDNTRKRWIPINKHTHPCTLFRMCRPFYGFSRPIRAVIYAGYKFHDWRTGEYEKNIVSIWKPHGKSS